MKILGERADRLEQVGVSGVGNRNLDFNQQTRSFESDINIPTASERG